jgi:hypothetical protein
MFHMLSCFNLEPGTRLQGFVEDVRRLDAQLRGIGMIESMGPVGRRQRHEVLDTDTDRNQEFFFITSFRDRAQGDRAVAYMFEADDPLHRAVYSQVRDAVFLCWEDLEVPAA